MKKVTMIVEFIVEVPDSIDIDDLCLDLEVDSILVGTTSRSEPVDDAAVISYETTAVSEVEKGS